MHTLLVLCGGAALLVACILLGHAFGGATHDPVWGAKTFFPLWLMLAAVNMWVGASPAGRPSERGVDRYLAPSTALTDNCADLGEGGVIVRRASHTGA